MANLYRTRELLRDLLPDHLFIRVRKEKKREKHDKGGTFIQTNNQTVN